MSCKTGFYLLAATLALGSCAKPTIDEQANPGSPAPRGPYYDLRAQLDSVVRVLNARHAGALKQVSVRNGATQATQVRQLNWADELEIFYQADINKAALRGAYAVHVTGGPGASGSRYEYTLKPGYPDAPVKRLDVTTYPGRRLRELAATIEQHNALFSGQKTLRLRLAASGDSSSYAVSGVQKLILFDSLRYRAAAKVL